MESKLYSTVHNKFDDEVRKDCYQNSFINNDIINCFDIIHVLEGRAPWVWCQSFEICDFWAVQFCCFLTPAVAAFAVTLQW